MVAVSNEADARILIDDQLRAALAKPYAVGLVPLANFLYSPAGVAFLKQQTQAYRPLMAKGRDLRVEGLRSAILRTAKGGTISAMAILRELPSTFVVELGGARSLRWTPLEAVLQAAA